MLHDETHIRFRRKANLMSILFWLAVLPSVLLASRVLAYDKIESEPPRLLAKLFALGMVSCLPASIIEAIGEIPIAIIAPTEGFASFLMYLFLVPFAEETMKYLMLRTTRNNPNFNYTFDGIVYSVMVGLGFATLENILYVLSDGTIGLAIMRGILSVPMHCTCAIFMGYYYGVAKGLEVQGLDDRAKMAKKLTIGVPWAIHGIYDFALDTDSVLVLMLGLVFTIVVFVLASRQIRFASTHDTPIVANISIPEPSSLPTVTHDWHDKGTPPPPVGR